MTYGKKGLRVSLICFLLSVFLLFSGCGESAGTTMNLLGGEITREVDLSEVKTPETVSIYATSYWDVPKEQIFDCFCHGRIVEKERWAEGPRYVTDAQREGITLDDGGLDFFGAVQEKVSRNGIGYSYYYDFYGLEDSGAPAILRDFSVSSYLQENLRDGNDGRRRILEERAAEGSEPEILAAKELVLSYMDQLDFPEHEMREAAVIPAVERDERICLLYFCQVCDGIPFTNLTFDKFASGPGNVYNRELDFDEDMWQMGSELEVYVTENEGIVHWYSDHTVMIEETLGTYQTISPQKAFQKVEVLYRNIPADREPRLRFAQLQYESLQKGEEMRIIPVWVFGVTEIVAGSGTNGAAYEEWHHYLVNAVTGEFFTDMEVP